MFLIKADQIDARFGNECGPPRDKIQRSKEHVSSAIAIRCFELVTHAPLCGEREPMCGDCRACDVAGGFNVTAIRELEAAFDSNVEDALAAYTAGTGGDTGEYLDNLQTGFATFYEGLEATLDQSSATTPSTSLISDLQDTVTTLLEDFAETLAGASEILPALSDPRGNGVAFEKFLREYASLSSLTDHGRAECQQHERPHDRPLQHDDGVSHGGP